MTLNHWLTDQLDARATTEEPSSRRFLRVEKLLQYLGFLIEQLLSLRMDDPFGDRSERAEQKGQVRDLELAARHPLAFTPRITKRHGAAVGQVPRDRRDRGYVFEVEPMLREIERRFFDEGQV